jgi:predicted PurR-regulated permease PerM
LAEKAESAAAREAFGKRTWLAVGIVAMVVALAALIWQSLGVLLLVFAGVLVGMLIRSLGSLFERISGGRLKEKVATGIAIVLLLAAVGGGVALAGHEITKQADAMLTALPAKIDQVRSQLAHSRIGRYVLPASGQDVIGRASGIFSTTLGVLGDLLVVAFLGIYFALDGRRYREGVVHLLPKKHRPRACEVSDGVVHSLHGWMLGQVIAMAIIAVAVTILLYALDVPMALLFGLLAGLLNFVPYIGPAVAIAPATLFALAESPTKAAWLVGCYLVIQLTESYVITPMIQKKTVHMPPALIIIAELLLGLWAGALGIILATPLAVVALVLIRKLWMEDQLGEKKSAT